jgi:metacaspase-1
MAQGLSIHIGLNSVDPDGYGGWDGQLVACEADAKDMAALAKEQGFTPATLLTADATSSAILDAIQDAGKKLSDGDILFLSYSGHGGQVPDANSDEDDRMDETWVAYDREIVDDELYGAWSEFASGTRIVVLSDSCHSGTVTKAVLDTVRPEAIDRTIQLNGSDPASRMKAMPADVGKRVYEEHKDEYDAIQKKVPAFDDSPLDTSVLLISGCQDNQTSADGQRNGLFTQTLLEVWNDGKFRGGYRGFAKHIVKKMPAWQTPNLYTAGKPDRAFERQHPFRI